VSGIAESSVQRALVDRLSKPDLGWRFVAGKDLDRQLDGVFIESEVIDALKRLNPVIAAQPDRVDEVLPRLRAVLLGVRDDGLVAMNERMVSWLRGLQTHRFVGTEQFAPVRLIDFDHPRKNSLVVSTEVTYRPGSEERRFDLVLWVNGFPVVVGETKTPVSKSVSWLNAAKDIHDAYEVKTPQFFVPNILSFATEGREFRYGAVRQPSEMWLPWSKTTDALPLPGMHSVMRSVELLLSPELVLDVLRTYTLFSMRSSTGGAQALKVIPRYAQVEAVDAIVKRVRDVTKRQGLVWHHQGSGKTLLMAFAAAKLRQQSDLDAPTILVVLDRLDLIEQTSTEFASVGIPGLKVAETKEQLARMLREDTRGVIVTTIFRFADAGFLNDRRNIVVMVDEAHRTQEGRLGLDMREALPNAKFIGLTGTPISTSDRNTWTTFGDPDDPDGVLNHYSVERSIADGATLPIHIETRLVDYHIDSAALDQAFKELAQAEGLDEREAGMLAKRASRVDALMKNPDRIRAVAADIVEHYRTRIEPLGLKAHVVVFDRELCVAYHDEITRLLADTGHEATVVMSCAKDDPAEWARWNLDREHEARIKDRFRDVSDPLKFLIVTAKLLTGFDAPIEGVMYLDKPLRAHTLFQAVCRTNRRWTNPLTDQEKLHGLVVDYVGLGNELAKAVAVKDTGERKALPAEVDELVDLLAEWTGDCLNRFTGVDRSASSVEQLFAAQNELRTQDQRDDFAKDFLRCEGLFEFLWPNTLLRPIEIDYRWLASIYASVMPTVDADRLLWQRLGAKTRELIAEYVGDVVIDTRGLQAVAIDAGTFEALRQMQLFKEPTDGTEPPTIDEVLETLEDRLRRKLAGDDTHHVWVSLAARLEALRKQRLTSAAASVEFLKNLLDLARQVLEAEKADAAGQLDNIRVVDPDRGALTQILEEFAPPQVPVMVEHVVDQIDQIVRPVRGTGWQTSQPGDREVRRQLRLVLKNNHLPVQGDLFDRAYAYIREHY
jgi:type I restriction enzyme R subunit